MLTALGRAPLAGMPAIARQAIQGRAILVTGAGGSIGAALARQIATQAPARLILLDQSEYGLWRAGQDIAEVAPAIRPHLMLADIRDAARLRAVLHTTRPDVIFHTAALKHVPMVEAHPREGLLTNTLGTRHLTDTARQAGARALVLVSTDKAVVPSSVMGASKRLAEAYIQASDIAARGRGEAFRCVSLRCGNVLGSTGSVMELFGRQIAGGGPITLTHPDMRRYLITPEEAVGFLLRAADLCAGDGLAAGAILVPEMGDPISILDLARHMIATAGHGREIEIRFTRPRPGEKLTERTFDAAEPSHPTSDPALTAVTPRVADLLLLGRAFDELETACRAGETHLALTLVSRLIPGFQHRLATRPEGSTDRRRA